jgi:hypothetical protein
MRIAIATTTLLALAVGLSPAMAQTTGSGTTGSGTTGETTGLGNHGTSTGATSDKDTPPLKGANSFTESEAKKRAEARGYSGVSDLKKDDDGIWRGRATQQGKQVEIAIDYKGNVVPTSQQ